MQPFSFFFLFVLGGGVISGRVRALNLTVPLGSGRVGTGQTISGTGRVRASVLSPCRPLLGSQWDSHKSPGFHPKYLTFEFQRRTKLSRVWNDMGVSN